MLTKESLLSLNSDTILNSITDAIVVIGIDKKVLFVNRAARDLIGTIGEERILGGEECKEVMGHSGCTLGCLLKKTIETGEAMYNYEAAFERDGKRAELSINTALLRDESGEVIGGVEVIRDTSYIKELEGELRGRYSFDNIIGNNEKLHELMELTYEVAPTKATVLIEGETGTGKELVANTIHYNSTRSEGPFIKLNCAALSENLLESELFGHVKGAFTGALADRAGRFELAHKGTLFLDEVGDISKHTQVRLLRALQEGEFERVGGTKTIKVDVRIITATNKDLKDAVASGEFREDLYYRLKVVPLRMPSLRERKDDIPLLVKHFVEKFNNEMTKEVTNVSPVAMEFLLDYDYPGNIRELEHIIEHAFVRCQGATINPEHLPKELRDGDIVGTAMTSGEPLKALEREVIRRVLKENGWRYKESAVKLQMSRTTLWRRMKDLGIEKRR